MKVRPDSPPAQAVNSVHATAHHLRKALGRPDRGEREGDRCRVASPAHVRFDAERFEGSIRQCLGTLRGSGGAGGDALARDPRSSLELYHGDLLEGETTGLWMEEHQDRLRALLVDGTLAPGGLREARGEWLDHADLYASVLPREDLNEELHRRIMTCWWRTGQRARSPTHYDRVVPLLQDALGAEPESETRDLADAIRTARL